MVDPILSSEDRTTLQTYVDRSIPGAPYYRRIQILLQADDGDSAADIAAAVGIPITRVRQMLRAYKREGLDLFPKEIRSPFRPYTADDPIADAGRTVMTSLLKKIRLYEPALTAEASVTSVHETRKGIRKLRTALQMFGPYYEGNDLRRYRKRFRKVMRRLSRSRDVAVFLDKLDRFITEGNEVGLSTAAERDALFPLRSYWQSQKSAADENVRRHMAKGSYQALLSDFEQFIHDESFSPKASDAPFTPTRVRYVTPVLIYEKLAAVRAYDDTLSGATVEQLHALRIRCKKLRYTLEFFEPVLGYPVRGNINTVKRLLSHLGDLNDARVHLNMLEQMPEGELAAAVSTYRAAKARECKRLIEEFLRLWKEFEQPKWRRDLSAAVSIL